MTRQWIGSVAACVASLISACDSNAGKAEAPPASASTEAPAGAHKATFAGGCFWCMEGPFERVDGVYSVVSGFSGGPEKNPTYEDVAHGRTGHTESVQVTFDPKKVSYASLLEVYWRSMDPTDAEGQFADRGKQYRPAIFVRDDAQRRAAEKSRRTLSKSGRFEKPVVVPIVNFQRFYPAEGYHQDYYRRHPREYKRYYEGSGRGPFLRRVWGEKHSGVAKRKPNTDRTKSVQYTKPPQHELQRKLSPLQFKVTQQEGTEPPFRNAYWDHKKPGIYVDVVTGEPLFSSRDKFTSGTGWPSFTRPLVADNVREREDHTLGTARTEVRSKHGDSHLGHVFDDGPQPTGLRYCINSAALRFIPAEDLEDEGYGEFAHQVE